MCLVPELCFLSGLDDRLRKNFTTMRALANHTRIAPKERELALRKYVESVSANEEAKRVLSVWGLKLSPTALVIPARILDSERLTLRNSTFITNMQCDWGKNLMNDILNPVKLDNWVLAVLERDAAKCMEFVTSFIDVGKRMGMVINSPTVIRLNNDRTDTYVNRIREEIGPKVKKKREITVSAFPALNLLVCLFVHLAATCDGHFPYSARRPLQRSEDFVLRTGGPSVADDQLQDDLESGQAALRGAEDRHASQLQAWRRTVGCAHSHEDYDGVRSGCLSRSDPARDVGRRFRRVRQLDHNALVQQMQVPGSWSGGDRHSQGLLHGVSPQVL